MNNITNDNQGPLRSDARWHRLVYLSWNEARSSCRQICVRLADVAYEQVGDHFNTLSACDRQRFIDYHNSK